MQGTCAMRHLENLAGKLEPNMMDALVIYESAGGKAKCMAVYETALVWLSDKQ